MRTTRGNACRTESERAKALPASPARGPQTSSCMPGCARTVSLYSTNMYSGFRFVHLGGRTTGAVCRLLVYDVRVPVGACMLIFVPYYHSNTKEPYAINFCEQPKRLTLKLLMFQQGLSSCRFDARTDSKELNTIL